MSNSSAVSDIGVKRVPRLSAATRDESAPRSEARDVLGTQSPVRNSNITTIGSPRIVMYYCPVQQEGV